MTTDPSRSVTCAACGTPLQWPAVGQSYRCPCGLPEAGSIGPISTSQQEYRAASDTMFRGNQVSGEPPAYLKASTPERAITLPLSEVEWLLELASAHPSRQTDAERYDAIKREVEQVRGRG